MLYIFRKVFWGSEGTTAESQASRNAVAYFYQPLSKGHEVCIDRWSKKLIILSFVMSPFHRTSFIISRRSTDWQINYSSIIEGHSNYEGDTNKVPKEEGKCEMHIWKHPDFIRTQFLLTTNENIQRIRLPLVLHV